MPNPVAAVSAQQTPPPPLPPPSRPLGDQDRDNSADESWSAADSDNDRINQNGTRALKRKRPLTVSCELCKQRKVKCDRAQPSCGWCSRNGQLCEYKERKKPGLRAGYGKELEQRLGIPLLSIYP
jgi:hypothetical protein